MINVTTTNGDEVYLNPAYIRSIRKLSDTSTEIGMNEKLVYEVQDTSENVLSKIAEFLEICKGDK